MRGVSVTVPVMITAVVVVSDINSQRDHKTAVLLGATHMIYIAKA